MRGLEKRGEIETYTHGTKGDVSMPTTAKAAWKMRDSSRRLQKARRGRDTDVTQRRAPFRSKREREAGEPSFRAGHESEVGHPTKRQDTEVVSYGTGHELGGGSKRSTDWSDRGAKSNIPHRSKIGTHGSDSKRYSGSLRGVKKVRGVK